MRLPSIVTLAATLLLITVSTPMPARAENPAPHATRTFRPGGIRAPYITPLLLRLGQAIRPREIFRVKTSERVVALTFDDGPSAKYMAEVLDVLQREQVKATFFLVGDRLELTNDAGAALRRANVQRAIRDGHEIAFHGWKHQSVGQSNERTFIEDLARFRRELVKLNPSFDPRALRFFRPPFGTMREFVHRVLAPASMCVVEASILPGDRYFFPNYFLEDDKRAVDRVIHEAQPGSVICLHVGEDLGRNDSVYHAVNAARIVAVLVPKLRANGYRFVRMNELVDRSSD